MSDGPFVDPKLSFAAALAGGVQQGVNAFQNSYYRAQQAEAMRQQAQATAQLRAMQMQKLQFDMSPVFVGIGQAQLLQSAFNRDLIPEDTFKPLFRDKVRQVVDAADTPEKISLVQKQLQSTTQGPVMPPGSHSESGLYDQSVPGSAAASPGRSPQSVTSTNLPAGPAGVFVDPRLLKFYGNVLGQQNAANMNTNRILGQVNTTAATLDQRQRELDTRDREFTAKLDNAIKMLRAKGQNDMALELERTRRAFGVANIQVEGRSAGASKDPMIKGFADQLKAIQAEKNKVYKPNSLGMAPMDETAMQQLNHLNAQEMDVLRKQAEYLKQHPQSGPAPTTPPGAAGGPPAKRSTGPAPQVPAAPSTPRSGGGKRGAGAPSGKIYSWEERTTAPVGAFIYDPQGAIRQITNPGKVSAETFSGMSK